jgi:hypothetical protein
MKKPQQVPILFSFEVVSIFAPVLVLAPTDLPWEMSSPISTFVSYSSG